MTTQKYTVENTIYKKHTVPRVIEIGSNYKGFLNAVNVLCNHMCNISFFHLSLQKYLTPNLHKLKIRFSQK